MTFLYYLVFVLHVTACFFLIGVVLLQQGKGQDLASAFGGGGSQAAFGPRGSANILSRATTILAGLFMVTSLSLTVLRPMASSTLLDRVNPGAPTGGAPVSSAPATSPAAPAPAAPGAAAVPAGAQPAAAAPGGEKGRPLQPKDVGPEAP